jgi:hypothetical protein
MKKLLIGLAALPLLAGVASAGQQTLLSDSQMDRVTAGQMIQEIQSPPSSLTSLQQIQSQSSSLLTTLQQIQSQSPNSSTALQQIQSQSSSFSLIFQQTPL